MILICTNCGLENIEGSNFCKKCGAHLIDKTSSSNLETPIIDKTSSPNLETPIIETIQDYEYNCNICHDTVELDESEVIVGSFVCPNCNSTIKIDKTKLIGYEEQREIEYTIPENVTGIPTRADQSIVSFIKCKTCNGAFSDNEELVKCSNCNALYHKLCFENNPGCQNPECNAAFKYCPNCKQSIKKDALKCKHCGKYLDSSYGPYSGSKIDLKEADTALTMAIISIFCIGFILAPIAIYKGNNAKKIIQENPDAYSGEGKATAAIIIGTIALILNILGFLIKLS